MIEVANLTKRYGRTLAVDDLSCTVSPGRVTGFLGPNGAGKSTTLRIILGLDAPTAGWALVDGLPYATIGRPLHTVGALLDAGEVHGGRTALDHLRVLARANRIALSRVVELLETVGLAGVARKRVGAFSLGMKQRLGIAAALLGDPPILMFDEPVNGLDPEGVRWIRDLMRSLASQGRTVLVSSHLMSEMALTADHVIVIGRGRLIADTSMSELVSGAQHGVLVRAPDVTRLIGPIETAGGTVRPQNSGEILVDGVEPGKIGTLALANGIALHELTPRTASLEEAFMRLTEQSVEFGARR